MDELNELNDRMKTMIESKKWIEELAVSFFCIFTPLGNYRKRKLLKLINFEIEVLKEEIEIEEMLLNSMLIRNNIEDYSELKKPFSVLDLVRDW